MVTPTQSTTPREPLRSLTRRICSGLMVKAAGFRRSQRGSIAILFALSMPVLIGGRTLR